MRDGWSFWLLFWLMDVGLTGRDFVRGFCRDAGRSIRTIKLERSSNIPQDCGIRNKGSSPASGQHAQQPKSHGPTCLCPRSKVFSQAKCCNGPSCSER